MQSGDLPLHEQSNPCLHGINGLKNDDDDDDDDFSTFSSPYKQIIMSVLLKIDIAISGACELGM